MKKVSIKTDFGDMISVIKNGLAVYCCHETAGHAIDLYVPDYESPYKLEIKEKLNPIDQPSPRAA